MLRRTIALVLVTSLASARAYAIDPEVQAAAEALFDEGKKLRAEGRYLEAAVKFEESQRLDPGVGTLLRLADSYEKAGRLASAWANFRQAESLARGRNDTQRADLARQRAAQLEPMLSRLAIDLGTNKKLKGLEVRRDGVVIEPSVAPVLVPVDVGIHTVVVNAPGYDRYEASVRVTEKDHQKTVSIPALSATPPPERAPLPAVSEPTIVESPAPSPPAEAEVEAEASSPVTPAVILGLGIASVAAIGVGTGFMISAISNDNDAADHCDGTLCRDPEGAALSQDAVSQAEVATGGFVAGGALAATALVLWLVTDGPSDGDSAALAFGPSFEPGRGLVSVGGSF